MDTVLIVKDTIPVSLVNTGDFCKQCIQEVPTNCNDTQIVAYICNAIVAVVFIVAVSFFVYLCIKNCRLRKEQEAKRIKEKEDNWFSLRKEYQGAILSILNPKKSPTQEKESPKERKNNQNELNDASEVKGDGHQMPNDASKEEKYIKELRACIEWIDQQK